MKEMYKDNAGNWHYGCKGEKLTEVSYSTNSVPNSIPIEWFKKKIDWHLDNLIYGAEVYQWVLNRWYEDKEIWEKEHE